jgi:putative DNA primase/helicase
MGVGAVNTLDRPAILPLNVDAVSAVFRAMPAWVGFQFRKMKSKWTKVPINLLTGGLAETDNPSTWVDFPTALTTYKQERLLCDGIGLVRTGDFVFLDLDGVLDPDGDLLPYEWAHKIWAALPDDVYSEISPSGTGLHVIARGTLPRGRRQWDEPGRDHCGFAFYDGNRYFTFTGEHWAGPPEQIGGGDVILKLWHELFGLANANGNPSTNGTGKYTTTHSTLSDSNLIERARKAKNGHLFQRLWAGDFADYPSQSEADLALCSLLAFWTCRDPARIDSLFRQSGLMREKWSREDYRERTIATACEITTETWTPPVLAARPVMAAPEPKPDSPEEHTQVKAEEKRKVTGIHANGKQAKPVPTVLGIEDLLKLDVPVPEMAIESMLPKSGASLLVGAAKSGKTILAVQRALAIATGKPLFGYYKVLSQGAALIIEQDDPSGAATIKTILQSAGVKGGIPLYVVPRVPFTFGDTFLEWLEQQISDLFLRYAVLDSYTSLRGPRGAGVDIVKAEQTDLTKLDALGKRTGCAIDVIHHSSKGSAALDWSEKAAGTFAMSAATEAQTHVSRFADLEGAAPERLVRVRGRHSTDVELVLRFRAETLDFEHVLEGGAAPDGGQSRVAQAQGAGGLQIGGGVESAPSHQGE